MIEHDFLAFRKAATDEVARRVALGARPFTVCTMLSGDPEWSKTLRLACKRTDKIEPPNASSILKWYNIARTPVVETPASVVETPAPQVDLTPPPAPAPLISVLPTVAPPGTASALHIFGHQQVEITNIAAAAMIPLLQLVHDHMPHATSVRFEALYPAEAA